MKPKPEMLPKSGSEEIVVRAEVLQEKLERKGWSMYRLAREVANVRNTYWGDNITDPKNISSSVTDAMKNPDKARAKQVEAIIIALGGTLRIDWEEEVTHIETITEAISINTPRDTQRREDPKN